MRRRTGTRPTMCAAARGFVRHPTRTRTSWCATAREWVAKASLVSLHSLRFPRLCTASDGRILCREVPVRRRTISRSDRAGDDGRDRVRRATLFHAAASHGAVTVSSQLLADSPCGGAHFLPASVRTRRGSQLSTRDQTYRPPLDSDGRARRDCWRKAAILGGSTGAQQKDGAACADGAPSSVEEGDAAAGRSGRLVVAPVCVDRPGIAREVGQPVCSRLCCLSPTR